MCIRKVNSWSHYGGSWFVWARAAPSRWPPIESRKWNHGTHGIHGKRTGEEISRSDSTGSPTAIEPLRHQPQRRPSNGFRPLRFRVFRVFRGSILCKKSLGTCSPGCAYFCDAHPKARTDALHIALVAHHRIQFLLTWNCRHIANAKILARIHTVLTDFSIPIPVICTPEEMLDNDPDSDD